MTIPRMLVLLAGLAGIGVAVVAIRVEEARALRRIQQLHYDESQARQEIRAQEMRLWTLRSPPTIRERSAQMRPAELPAPPRGGAAKTASKKR